MSSLVDRVVDGRYRIEALLGEGAVGAVYRVRELSSGRVMALKQWSVSAIDAQIRGRFLRETTALDTFDHPNIVKVFGHGLVDDVPYMVLEYLEGDTLERLLHERGVLDVALALDIARQALSAIAYAHDHDIVHRDIKPENIFLAAQPGGRVQVKILDYGLAKFMAHTGDPTRDKTLTATGMVVGTPLYMPPEQATGVSVDLPVDVYAMGCVLYEMLTGRLPFDGETRKELLTAHMRDPIPRLAQAGATFPEVAALQAILDRALAKQQTQRYQHARAMLTDLERIGAARPATEVREPPPAPRASDTRLMLALGTVMLATLAILFWLMF